MKKIGVTDSLFIHQSHEEQLKKAGFAVERLDKPDASEQELCDFLKDKSGYILGGIEQVGQKVIDAADKLEAIVFTGTGYKDFIPAWKHASEKGIAIANVPNGHTYAVAEWAIAAALAMNRGFFSLGTGFGDTVFATTAGLENQTIGIIGMGRIGSNLTKKLPVFKPKTILYASAHRHPKYESDDVVYKQKNEVLKESDIIFLCVSRDAGENFISAHELALMKPNALLVSIALPGVINADALFEALQAQKIRAISDYPMDERFIALSPSYWYSFKNSNAFNTAQGLCDTSDGATSSMINLLTKQTDQNQVNAAILTIKE